MNPILKCPRNRKQLYRYIKDQLGYVIPDKAVADNNISPFDFISEMFFEEVSDVIAIGSRGSGKTLDLAIIHVLNSIFKKNCETGTVGAVERQAKKCYSYFQNMLKKYDGTGRVGNTFISETLFHTPAKVEILVATMYGMNSPHPQKAFLDEFDLVEWKIFQEFLNLSQSFGGVSAQNVLTTTYKYPNGTAVKLIRQRKEMGFDFRCWSVWEAGETCTVDSCDYCDTVVKGTFPGGEPRTFKRVCNKKLKRANGFLKLRDTLRRFKSLDIETWIAQQECKRPSKNTAVFYWLDPEKHLDRQFDTISDAQYYEGIDWGGSAPTAYVLWMEKEGKWYLVDELYFRNIAASDFADMVLAKRRRYSVNDSNLVASYADPANTIAILEFEKKGIELIGAKKDKDSIINGISIINSLGVDDRVCIHERCINAKREWAEYHYPEGTIRRNPSNNPAKKDDHTIDSSRYIFYEENPVGMSFLSGDLLPENEGAMAEEAWEFSTANIFGQEVADVFNGGILFDF